MKPITLSEAKNLKYGTIIYCISAFNANGTYMRFKVNGKAKTWIKSPNRVSVPIKRGLYEYNYLTEVNISDFSLTEQ